MASGSILGWGDELLDLYKLSHEFLNLKKIEGNLEDHCKSPRQGYSPSKQPNWLINGGC